MQDSLGQSILQSTGDAGPAMRVFTSFPSFFGNNAYMLLIIVKPPCLILAATIFGPEEQVLIRLGLFSFSIFFFPF